MEEREREEVGGEKKGGRGEGESKWGRREHTLLTKTPMHANMCIWFIPYVPGGE